MSGRDRITKSAYMAAMNTTSSIEKTALKSDDLRAWAQLDADGRKTLVGLSREELDAELASHGLPKFRARQLWHWMYHQGETDFAKMTTLGKELRSLLTEHYVKKRKNQKSKTKKCKVLMNGEKKIT